MTLNSDILVLALKVQEMQLAKRKYFAHLSAPVEQKKAVLRELQDREREVDTLINAVLTEANETSAYHHRKKEPV